MDIGDAVREISESIPDIMRISDEKIRSDTASIYQELLRESEWKDISQQYMTSKIPVSGIEHVNAVVAMSMSMAKIIADQHSIKVNMDYLISGAILHDASKLAEYEPSSGGETRTKLGDLGQHTMKCVALMISRKMPEEIIHIVVSHTPQSATLPKTVESVIVYFADSADYNVLRIVHKLGADIRKG